MSSSPTRAQQWPGTALCWEEIWVLAGRRAGTGWSRPPWAQDGGGDANVHLCHSGLHVGFKFLSLALKVFKSLLTSQALHCPWPPTNAHLSIPYLPQGERTQPDSQTASMAVCAGELLHILQYTALTHLLSASSAIVLLRSIPLCTHVYWSVSQCMCPPEIAFQDLNYTCPSTWYHKRPFMCFWDKRTNLWMGL